MMTFLELLDTDIIPRIEAMLEKEKQHKQSLLAKKANNEFVTKSEYYINQYEKVLENYKNYLNDSRIQNTNT